VQRSAKRFAVPVPRFRDEVGELAHTGARRALLRVGDAKPVLDPLTVRRPDHHLFLEEVVRKGGRLEALT
jgi:hypothetical protein